MKKVIAQAYLPLAIIIVIFSGCIKADVPPQKADSNKIIYFGSALNLYALNAINGLVKWKFSTNEGIFYATPVIVGGVIYTGNSNGDVYAINTANGSQIWKYGTKENGNAVGSSGTTSPMVVNGIVYIASTITGKLHAINAVTGKVKWTKSIGFLSSDCSPTVINNVVYIGSSSTDNVFALDAATGQEKWVKKIPHSPSYVNAGAAVLNGIVYVSTYYYQNAAEPAHVSVYALNSSDGSIHGVSNLYGATTAQINPVASNPTIANGLVYIASKKKVYAVSTTDFSKKWEYTLGGSIFGGSPTINSGTLYIGAGDFVDKKLYALNAINGSLKWSYQTQSGIPNCVTASYGVVYVRADKGLLALNANTGTKIWQFTQPEGNTNGSSPTIVTQNGLVIYPSDSGHMQ